MSATAQYRNRHPVDQLAEVRAQIRVLQEEEERLRGRGAQRRLWTDRIYGPRAYIGAESVCLLSGAGLLPGLENFRCLCAAITANPLRPRALPLAHSDF